MTEEMEAEEMETLPSMKIDVVVEPFGIRVRGDVWYGKELMNRLVLEEADKAMAAIRAYELAQATTAAPPTVPVEERGGPSLSEELPLPVPVAPKPVQPTNGVAIQQDGAAVRKDGLWNVFVAADYLDMPPNSLNQMCLRGTGPAFVDYGTKGRANRQFAKAELDRWYQARMTPMGDPHGGKRPYFPRPSARGRSKPRQAG